MSALPSFLTRFSAHRPWVVMGLVLVITMTLTWFAPQSELSNDSTSFSPRTDEVEALDELRARFDDSSTATLQVVVTGDDVISVDGVQSAVLIDQTAQDVFGEQLAGNGAIITYAAPTINAAAANGLDVAALDDAAIDDLQRAGLAELPAAQADRIESLAAGDDATSADAGLVLVTLDRSAFADDDALAEAQRVFIDELDAQAIPLETAAFSTELVRAPDDSFQQEVARLFLFAALVILIVLALVLRARRGEHLSGAAAIRRSMADMGLAIGGVVIAIMWNQGIAVLLGPNYLGIVGEPTPPTQIVPILLLALGVSYAIHTHSRYREELARGNADPTAVAGGLGRTVGVALALSMLTTGFGFLTNLFSPLPAIQDLGVLAATGIVAVFIVDLTFLVAGRTLLDRRAHRNDRLPTAEIAPQETATLSRVATIGLRPALGAPVAVLAITGAVTVASAFAGTQLETEFSPVDFLADSDPSKAAFIVLDESFGGGLAETTDVLVTGPEVLTPAAHNATALVADGLAGEAGIITLDNRPAVVSPVSALADAQLAAATDAEVAAVGVAQAAGLQPDGTIEASGDVAVIYGEMAAAFPTVGAVVDPFATTDGVADPAVRLSISTQSEVVGVSNLRTVVDDSLVPLTATGVTAVATSNAIVDDLTINAMSDSAVTGLLLTLAAVTALLAGVYWFRSRRAGLGALVVLPVAIVVINTFGLMWIFGIPFDPITAIVSALVVGVGVDFCIHLGERFTEDLEAADGDIPTALRRALRHTGAALAGSAATTILGFAVLMFGSIVPFQRLGFVMTSAMVLSLLAVVFVLPAILVLYGRFQNSRRNQQDPPEAPSDGSRDTEDLVSV